MNGDISHNRATGGVNSTASGIHIANGTLTLGGAVRDHLHGTTPASIGRGVFLATNANLQLNDGSVTGNTTEGNGAGILALGTAGTLGILAGSRIEYNLAEGSGGGIWAERPITIGDFVSFRRNEAEGNGGAIRGSNITIDGGSASDEVIFFENEADYDGGALWSNGTVNIAWAIFEGNTAGRDGGAISMEGEATTATINRLTTSNTTRFVGNTADSYEELLTAQGITNFPNINWHGENSRGGNRNVNPVIDHHLLNNYDVHWDHPFHTVRVSLQVEDAHADTVGIGSPTVTLTVPTATPGNIILTTVDDDYRTIDSPTTALTTPLSVSGLNPNWFEVRAYRQVAGVAAVNVPLTMTQAGNIGTWVPTTATDITVTAGTNVTVLVRIRALAGPLMNINLADDIDFGTHYIDFVGSQVIRLGDSPTNGTQPSEIDFQIFHDNSTAAGWTLDVRSEEHAGSSNTTLASRMFSEMVGNYLIYNTNTRATTSARINDTASLPVMNFNWGHSEFDGVEVRTEPGEPPVIGTHQADMIWTLSPGVLPWP